MTGISAILATIKWAAIRIGHRISKDNPDRVIWGAEPNVLYYIWWKEMSALGF